MKKRGDPQMVGASWFLSSAGYLDRIGFHEWHWPIYEEAKQIFQFFYDLQRQAQRIRKR